MKEVIDSEAFLGLPTGWQVFFGLIIALFLAVAFLASFKGFRKLMGNFLQKILHIAKQEPLLMHELFYDKDYFYGMIYRMNFLLPEKTELFRIITKNKVDTTIKLTREFIKENQKAFDGYSPHKLRGLLYSSRNNINKQSSRESKNQFIELYGSEKGKKIWNLIYESENGYKKYWEDKNKFLDKNIDRLVESQSRSNTDNIRSILNQIYIAIDIAILDCEETFNGLNGQIADLITK